MRDSKLKQLVRTAIFSAIIAVLAQLSLPMPNGVPITLQTFAIALAGFFLGPLHSAVAVGIYVLLGGIGLPVFSGLRGGLAVLAGPTGGFIIGFIPMAVMAGLSHFFKVSNFKSLSSVFKILVSLVLATLGLLCCHLIGAWHFSNVTSRTLIESLPLVSYPFIVKDVLSIIFAYLLCLSINNRISGAISKKDSI